MALALGRTVGELRAQMTYRELLDWITYAEKWGGLNPMVRQDAAVARLITAWVGGSAADHMPYPREPEPEATPEAVFAMLKAKARPKPDATGAVKEAPAKVVPITRRRKA